MQLAEPSLNHRFRLFAVEYLLNVECRMSDIIVHMIQIMSIIGSRGVFDDDDMAMIMNSLIEAYRGASNGSYTID